MRRKFYRTRHYDKRERRIHPILIVGICILAALLVALIVGNILRRTVDEETYQKITSGIEASTTEEPVEEPISPKIQAYPFLLGTSLNEIPTDAYGSNRSALSVPINKRNGEILYTSPVADHLQNPNAGPSLTATMEQLVLTVPYVSGVFYPQATGGTTEDLRYARTAEEAALLREFLHAGASEIILMELPMDAEHITSTLVYLQTLRELLPYASIGVSISLSDAMGENGWEILPELTRSGCFCLLDLRELSDETASDGLATADYLIRQYGMCPVVGADQPNWIALVEGSVSSYRIIPADDSTQS